MSDSSKDSKSQLYTHAIRLDSAQKSLALASDDLRFAAAVAGLGQLLNGSVYLHGFDWRQVAELADSAKARTHTVIDMSLSAWLAAPHCWPSKARLNPDAKPWQINSAPNLCPNPCLNLCQPPDLSRWNRGIGKTETQSHAIGVYSPMAWGQTLIQ